MEEIHLQNEKYEHFIHHVFLTRRLPHKEKEEDCSGKLVQLIFNHLPNIEMPMLGLNFVRKTMEIWKNIQIRSVDDVKVKDALLSLQPGQTFAIYARAHNSVITVMRSEHNENALMSVFRALPNNQKALVEGDLFQTFPERAIWIPFDRFLSDAFSRQVTILSNNSSEDILTKARKAGVEYADCFDVAEPVYVISWLLGAMSGMIQGDENFESVQKVIRHEVLWEKGFEKPWRRSGEWFAIKCVLQIMLTIKLGKNEGTIVYKSLMIHIMSSFLNDLPGTYDDNDIIMQMLSKVSRRMIKLKNCMNNFKQNKELSNQTIEWVNIIFENGYCILKKKRDEADNRWINHTKSCCKLSKVNVSELCPLEHTTHNLNELAVTRINQAFKEEENSKTDIKIPECLNRWNNANPLFDIIFLENVTQNDETEIKLYDFEAWVRIVLWKDFSLNITQFHENSSQIFNLFHKYLEISVKFYANDPVGLSRMVLTLLLIIAVLDSIAIKKSPLLAEYHSSLEDKYFDSLLTPLLEDIKYLHSVKAYFDKRNTSAIYPCILSNRLQKDSFGPKLANEDEEMQKKRKEILLYAQKQREEKKSELQRKFEEFNSLMAEHDRKSHYMHCGKPYFTCFKCEIYKKATSIEIDVYEDPIPEDCVWKQNAIVFELNLPVSIRCLRDALFLIHKRLDGKQFQNVHIKQPWRTHPELRSWISFESQRPLVSIGSDAALISSSRFKVHNIHAFSNVEDVLKPCGLTIKPFINYKLYKRKNVEFINVGYNQIKKKFCTMKAWNEPYKINENWIAETTHTENEVLASQVECPLNIKLDEYKAFGSLRAGHRLQLRKMLKAIEMRSLSFENSSVFALIAQTLWQAGPTLKKDDVITTDNIDDPVLLLECHSDLQNDKFCHALLECLSIFLKNNSKNWKKHNQLHIVIIITLRIFSLSSDKVRSKASKLLFKCRSIAQIWAVEIESLLSKSMTSSINEVQEIRLKLIDVAAFAALTFDVDGCFEYVINKDSLVQWLHSVARIHDNIHLGNTCFDIERKNLLRRVRHIGLRFENVAKNTFALENVYIFTKFLTSHWADFCKGNCRNLWVSYPQPFQTWYYNFFDSNNSSRTLQINILSGRFLVDGNPVGRLPDAITKSSVYQRIFSTHVFDVQPSAGQFSSFVSVHDFQGSRFLFSIRKDEHVIVERTSSGNEYELIPFDVFNGLFPKLLINKYSHWLCKKTKIIYFRPVRFDDANFFNAESEEHFPYQFNVFGKTFYDLQRKQYLVDINSNTFKEVYSCLYRLELRDYVHIWVSKSEPEQSQYEKEQYQIEQEKMDINEEQGQRKKEIIEIKSKRNKAIQENMQTDQEQFLTKQNNKDIEEEQYQAKKVKKQIETEEAEFSLNVELPRMGLSFKVEVSTGKIFSHEHNGLIVANDQGNIGTLVGLENSLLLHEDKPLIDINYVGQQKVLIVPHSKKFELTKSSIHQNMRIDLNELLSPPQFSYNIDDRLCELRGPANQEAWLYLSLLHAATSSSLPDPFTRLTGTESSMRLLQIGRTFSCRPFDINAIHSLKNISKLAPRREQNTVYSQSFQSVTWFPHLYSTYGYEGLVLASNILLYHADMYKELFPINQQEKKQQENILTKRAYWRYKTQLNSCAHLDVENEKFIGGVPKREMAWYYTSDCHENNVSRLIMNDYYKRIGVSFVPTNLWAFVEDKKNIKNPLVISLHSMFTHKNFDLLDNYLNLYELAQNVREDFFDFCLLLSLLAFKGENVDLLFSLLAVVILKIQVNPPSLKDYERLNETELNLKEIEKVVKEEFLKSNLKNMCSGDKISKRNFKNIAISTLGDKAKEQWKAKKVDFHSIGETKITISNYNHSNVYFGYSTTKTMPLKDIVNIDNVEKKVKNLFLRWDNNSKLKSFFNEVECQIRLKNSSLLFDVVTSLKEIHAPNLSNLRSAEPFLSCAYDIKIPITNLEENQNAINLYQKTFSEAMLYAKNRCDSLNVKSQSDEVSSLLQSMTDGHDNNDDILKFMKINLENSCKNLFENDYLYLNKNDFQNTKIINELQSYLYNSRSKDLWKEIENAMMPQYNDHVNYALLCGGLWRRITPVIIIPCILPITSLSCTLLAVDAKYVVPQSVINRVGALIVSWTTEQRAIRCLKLIQNKMSPVVLYREMINVGHENWIPSSHPEWLILELEANFLIRPIQIDVAQSMINANENFVQQLNMGEGKTSVIVPLLAVSLATSEHVIRVTVLRSLLNTNFELLVDKLGGLLNRRVYIVPCRRDLILKPSKILRVYEECLVRRGIMLTTPEYRLSLNLKTLEHCRKKSEDAENFYQLRCWLQKHIRDVLDEADEILNVKYQVVYTLGQQRLVDSGELRWIISQAVLKLVSKFAERIFNRYGEKYIEYYVNNTRYDSFSHIRFLSSNESIYKDMCHLIIDSVLNNEVPEVSVTAKLKQSDKEYARSFITSNDISDPEMQKQLSKLFDKNTVLKEELLILRGLLLFEVLNLALQKRWRVNFGVNLSNTISKMAVPFRAKDVALEKTEFGHPDMAIILTQISYYMSGLSESQLDEVFFHLDKTTNKEVRYEQWITAIGIANVPKDLRELNGVNLDSIEQKKKLYSLLSYSMSVVNFWLNQVVYPREAKQFPIKILTSAWDLCLKNKYGHKYKNYTTGFSGTNELQLLYPLTIRQKDLPKISGTNAMVLNFLLRPENKTYYHISSSVNTIEECVLKKLIETKACVLIDVGALMLKMDNKKVALEWLKISLPSEVSAAVYFDQDDKLMVCDRKGRTSLLSVSPYFHKLNECVVYLDDIHTRGTDLKFPVNAIACVTLGKGLTKDRLVQACMRMRLLGNGHRVYFCASNDIHISIISQMKFFDRIPETGDILKWALYNSCNAVRDGLLDWSSQGIRYATKEAVEMSMFNDNIFERKLTLDSLQELGIMCSEDEMIKLENFYGGSRSLECIPEIVQNSLDKRVNLLKKNNKANETFLEILNSFGANIISRCTQYVSKYKRFANILDEEQERELEVELEEERQVERPPRQNPHKPKLSKEVRDLAETGTINQDNCVEILSINRIFQNTGQISELMPTSGWSHNFLVTNEFTMVIEDTHPGDDFLFEISWVIVVSPKNDSDHATYVVICSFEANELIPIFRSKTNCDVRLHMFAPRLRRGQSILIDRCCLVLPECKNELLDNKIIVQLFVIGGGLFFLNREEEDAYSSFIRIFQSDKKEVPAKENLSNSLCDSSISLQSKYNKSKTEFDACSYTPPCKKIKLDFLRCEKKFVKVAIEILRSRGRYMNSTMSDVCQLLFHGTKSF